MGQGSTKQSSRSAKSPAQVIENYKTSVRLPKLCGGPRQKSMPSFANSTCARRSISSRMAVSAGSSTAARCSRTCRAMAARRSRERAPHQEVAGRSPSKLVEQRLPPPLRLAAPGGTVVDFLHRQQRVEGRRPRRGPPVRCVSAAPPDSPSSAWAKPPPEADRLGPAGGSGRARGWDRRLFMIAGIVRPGRVNCAVKRPIGPGRPCRSRQVLPPPIPRTADRPRQAADTAGRSNPAFPRPAASQERAHGRWHDPRIPGGGAPRLRGPGSDDPEQRPPMSVMRSLRPLPPPPHRRRTAAARCRAGGPRGLMAVIGAAMILVLSVQPAGAQSRIKDIVDVQGVRDNMLIGYGLVVGLDGSGDSLNGSPFTEAEPDRHAGAARRQHPRRSARHPTISPPVMVTARTLPPFTDKKGHADRRVGGLAGRFLQPPGRHAPGHAAAGRRRERVYAVAQGGPVSVSGFNVQGERGSLGEPGKCTKPAGPDPRVRDRRAPKDPHPPCRSGPGRPADRLRKNPDFTTAAPDRTRRSKDSTRRDCRTGQQTRRTGARGAERRRPMQVINRERAKLRISARNHRPAW